MFLEISSGSGFAPVVGVEPCDLENRGSIERASLEAPCRRSRDALLCGDHETAQEGQSVFDVPNLDRGFIKVHLWRKLVGVEPTCDTKCRTLVLKTRPSTGQD